MDSTIGNSEKKMGLRLPTVEKFLCCCELQTGVKLIGVLTLLGALCGCFASSILLSLSALGTAAANGAFGQFNFTKADQDLAGFSQEKKDAWAGLGLSGDAQSVTTTVLAWTTAMLAILLIICIGYVVVASMLIHGARKAKPGLMMPWLVLTIISLLFNLVQIIGNLVNGYYNLVYSGLFGFIIGFYIFIVVWSHRKELQGLQQGSPVGQKA
jgi:hypothetical protein